MNSEFRFDEIPLVPVDEVEQPLLKINLSACSHSKTPQWIEVTVKPTGDESSTYMNHNVVLDGKWRAYDFSVPLTQIFDIHIDVWPKADIELGNTVKLSYWTGKKIEFELENATSNESSRKGGQRWSARGLSLFLLRNAA
jgi:hypothetical protein